ncbi:hypothetical protein IWW50_001328 [Coemansia erecta]|nr:hypothetical protein IWW50_001328 [Coemansia erecta]
MTLQYGYLHGTFGLPYGGYCIRPPSLTDIVLQASNEHRWMFCVIGRFHEVSSWLENRPEILVRNQSSMESTFTHELVAEVYTESSALSRMFWGLDNLDVKLIIRIARTWDRRRDSVGCQFHPLLKLIVPSGVALGEIRERLRDAVPGQVLDATRDKVLLNRALAQVSTHESGWSRNAECTRMSLNTLPPYEYRRVPPSYYD